MSKPTVEVVRNENLPERSRKGQGKNELFELSHCQQNPRDTKPTDFQITNEDALEFGGACGDSKAEYNRLTKVGEQIRRDPRA